MGKKRIHAKAAQRRPHHPGVPHARTAGETSPEYSAVITLEGRPAMTLRFGQEIVETAYLYYGDHFPEQRQREIKQGWGFSVEVPAVADLLEAVAAGRIGASQVREALLGSVAQHYDSMGCFEDEKPSVQMAVCLERGGCPLCLGERKEWFDGLLDYSDRQWARLNAPDQYPYTASKSGVHETTCSVVKRENPTEYARPVGAAYVEALRRYAHTVNPWSDRDDFEGWATYPRMNSLTVEETRQWITDHTGPKGGRNFKRCQRCAPAV